MILPLLLASLALQAQALLPADEGVYRKAIESHRGRVVLAGFWATWCAPCRLEMPRLVALAARYRSKGVVLVTISGDEPEDEAAALRFLRETKPPPPWYVKRARDDDRFIRAVDPGWSGALPALFLYGRTGRKEKTFIGETSPAQIEAAVKGLL